MAVNISQQRYGLIVLVEGYRGAGMFTGEARAAFRRMLDPDDATWAGARGWAVKSVYGVLYYEHTNAGIVERCRRRVRAVLEETATSSTQ